MSLNEMIMHIHRLLKEACFSDAVEDTGLAPSTIWIWRNNPPALPSLKVFTKLARYAGLDPSLKELEPLL